METSEALQKLVDGLGGGEVRRGQQQMAEAIDQAIKQNGRVAIGAPTGSGKSFAATVPPLVHKARAVLVTNNIALQEQYTRKDLPYVTSQLGGTFGLLMGKNNYLCAIKTAAAKQALLQRAQETLFDQEHPEIQIDGDEVTPDTLDEIEALLKEAEETRVDIRTQFSKTPSAEAWKHLAVQAGECPGNACPKYDTCVAVQAQAVAFSADILVVNVAMFSKMLNGSPENVLREVLLIDEAHGFADAMITAQSTSLSTKRVRQIVNKTRSVMSDPSNDVFSEAASRYNAAIKKTYTDAQADNRSGYDINPEFVSRPLPGNVMGALSDLSTAVTQVLKALNQTIQATGSDTARTKMLMTREMLHALSADLATASAVSLSCSAARWVERSSIEMTDVNVANFCRQNIWSHPNVKAVALFSATLPNNLGDTLGIDNLQQVDVEGPFDIRQQAKFLVPRMRYSPKEFEWQAESVAAAKQIVTRAQRGLSLHTSIAHMNRCADAYREIRGIEVWTYKERDRAFLVERLKSGDNVVVCATRGWFEGVDIGGLPLVLIDKIPMGQRDPIATAKERVAQSQGKNAFMHVAVPAARTSFQQAFGRLIRSRNDHGIVACLDNRFGSKWGREVASAVPKEIFTSNEDSAFQIFETWAA